MNYELIQPAEGRLGILIVGNGAVATTFVTGVLMARKGLGKPIGSMTQYDRVRVGDNKRETINNKREAINNQLEAEGKRYLHYGEIVPLAKLDDLVFGCWDVYPQNAYQAAVYAEVLRKEDIDSVRDELE